MDEVLQNFEKCFKLASEISINNDFPKLISVLENWNMVHENVKPIFSDLVESFGFYPYLDTDKLSGLNLSGQIRNEYHKSEFLDIDGEPLKFHFEQKLLSEKIESGQNLLVSAPTSFGKSLLINEFVARRNFKNILIIQPTLALIDETRRNLQKHADYYNIVVNTKQELKENNLFILTSERVLDILSLIETKKIELFVVDEFYKISNGKQDDRLSQLNLAFYKIMGFNSPQLLLLTPNIDSIDNEFITKYNLEFFKTNYSLVNQQTYKIQYEKGNESSKRSELLNLLNQLNEPTIIYVRSPNQAEQLAEFCVENLDVDIQIDLPIFSWINENINEDWHLKRILRSRIGIHNGQFPRHLVNSQLQYFNENKLNLLFATASLIEGVNTSAKNIIIYDQKKGNKKLTYFDFNNIKGRAGRMMKHFSGNVYYFDEPPVKTQENIDVPIVSQDESIPSEILVNLNDEDVRVSVRDKYDHYKRNIEPRLLEVMKNNFYDMESQVRLYNYLINNPDDLKKLCWHESIPRREIFKETMRVIYQELDGKTGDGYSYLSQKSYQLIRYGIAGAIGEQIIHNNKKHNIKGLSHKDVVSKSVMEIFRFIRIQAKFEIPKKLGILESLVNFISQGNHANYSSFISLLENEGVDNNISVLLDYGVPSSALKKIKSIPDDVVDVVDYIKSKVNSFNLTEYEKNIILKL